MEISRIRRESGEIDADAEAAELRDILAYLENWHTPGGNDLHYVLFHARTLARLGRRDEATRFLKDELDHPFAAPSTMEDVRRTYEAILAGH